MRPDSPAWADSAAGRSSDTTTSVRMSSGLRGKERQRIGLEDGPALAVIERQRHELIDVLSQILDAGARPVGAPEDAVGDLRQAGKVLQQLGRRNARHVQS